MFKNYFKIASRYLLQNKGYSIVNILGLAIGITCCILIMLFVRSEWSFDSFHTKSDRIYRAWLFEDYGDQKFTNTQTPIPLGPTLQANIPEIEEACRVYVFNTLVQKEADKFNEPINMVDTNFFKVFDFKILKGNNTNPFQNSNSIVITTSTQNKYFSNNSDVIGQTLDIQMGAEKKTFLITAVTSDPPKESSIQFKFLIPHSNEKLLFRERNITSGWTNVFLETYVLARTGVSGKAIEAKIPGVAKKISGDNYKAGEYNIFFQPITDIHLNKILPAGNEPISDPFYSYILATLGLLILIIACINFITLSIGQSAKRAKEVGVRKVMGALRPQLISQFWGEAIIVILTAFIISIALSFILLKPFNEIANKSLTLSFDGFNLSFCISIILLVSLAAGVYPAVILSGFVPVQVLKGKLQSAVGIGLFRKGLIVAQFVASIIMIISTLVISQQLNFIRNKNLGYDKEHIVVVPTNKSRAEGLKLAELFRNELKNIPQVLNSTTS
ncbi:MAG: ABC transporter permease, partial [Saprospiraceae bacterium]